MAEYLIKESSLTQMADAVRAMTGTTGKLKLDALEAKMTESGEDIGEATELIAQIAEALEGKAAGGGSGGNTDIEDAMVTRTLSAYTNDRVTTIGNYAFANCASLTTVSFPNCTTIGSGAFSKCSRLTIASFQNCTTISSSAFYQCSNLTSAPFPVCTNIGDYAFYFCSNLTTASFPNCTSIGTDAFLGCESLTAANFPACTTIGGYAFENCTNLTTVSFPVCTIIGSWAFGYCENLTSVSFPACTNISSYTFYSCSNLTNLTLANSSMCTLANSNAFSYTPIARGTGYIYVPYALVSSYKTATNWTYFANQISAISDSTQEPEEPDNELITFTVDDVEYQAEEGMTWEDWVNSNYNIDLFTIEDDMVQPGSRWYNVVDVYSYNIIQPGAAYDIGRIGGGE